MQTRAHRYFQTSLLTRGLPISSCLILFRSQSRRTRPDRNPSGHQTYHPVRPRHVLYADVEGDQAIEALQASTPEISLFAFAWNHTVVCELTLGCFGWCRHENIIAILDILRPRDLDSFKEVYLIQVSTPPAHHIPLGHKHAL